MSETPSVNVDELRTRLAEIVARHNALNEEQVALTQKHAENATALIVLQGRAQQLSDLILTIDPPDATEVEEATE